MEHEGLPPFSVNPTDTASNRWEKWIRRLENFLIAKDINEDDRKRAMLLHYVGEEVFDLADSVGVLDGDRFAVVKKKLTDYFAPKRNVEFEVFTFRQAEQNKDETLDQFHARLQRLAKNCDFNDKSGEIKSQIIQKCVLKKLRDKGLCEPEYTLDQLMTYGHTLESTQQHARAMAASTSHPDPVNAVTSHPVRNQNGSKPRGGHRRNHRGPFRKQQQQQSNPASTSKTQSQPPANRPPCVGCGGGPHDRRSCPAWGRTCYKCHRPNHMANVCRRGQNRNNTHYVQGAEAPVVYVPPPVVPVPTIQPPTLHSVGTYNLDLYHATSPSPVIPYMCHVTVEGIPITLEIDTGASKTLVSADQWD